MHEYFNFMLRVKLAGMLNQSLPDCAIASGDEFDQGRHIGVLLWEVDVKDKAAKTVGRVTLTCHQGTHHVHALLILVTRR